MAERKPIGEMLVEAGEVSRAQLDEALKLQKKMDGNTRLGLILVELGYLKADVLTKYLRMQTEDVISKFKKASV